MKVVQQAGTFAVDTGTGSGTTVVWKDGMDFFAIRFRTEDGPRFQPLLLRLRESKEINQLHAAAHELYQHLGGDRLRRSFDSVAM